MVREADQEGIWPLSLAEAIRSALDHDEIVRVISQDVPPACVTGPPSNASPIVIARLNADASLWRFKSAVMAEVRSVEQKYWHLVQARAQHTAAEHAAMMTQDVLNRQQAEFLVGRGTVDAIAETTQWLEQFHQDLVRRTSDVIACECQMRNLLGLPKTDSRRIVPTTKPSEERIEYDWDSCLSEMMQEQPDIVQQQALVRVAELQLLVARNQLVPPFSLITLYQLNGLGPQLDSAEAVMTGRLLSAFKQVISRKEGLGQTDCDLGACPDFTTWQVGYALQMPMGRSSLTNTRQAQYILLRSRAYLQQVIHQTTHSLARFFLEVDAGYKQYHQAQRVRAAAAQRLDAQCAAYEAGCIAIDRLLDAISQDANAQAQEAQDLSTYNIALAELSEAKGTLLADRNIVVATGPRPRRARKIWQATTAKRDEQARPVSFEPEKNKDSEPTQLQPALTTTATTTCKSTCSGQATDTTEAEAAAKTKAKTWTFSIRIGGPQSLQIKGTITVGDNP
jgi:outer membrane protein TolC